MANSAGAPRVCSLRTIKSDVVVGFESNTLAEKLDKEEPGWKISGKYVSSFLFSDPVLVILTAFGVLGCGAALGRTTW